jgi:hypothetical protein
MALIILLVYHPKLYKNLELSSLCKFRRHKKNVRIASIIKIIMSHFAISIEKPATPRAPSTYAINANIRKTTASPIKSGIFHSPSD